MKRQYDILVLLLRIEMPPNEQQADLLLFVSLGRKSCWVGDAWHVYRCRPYVLLSCLKLWCFRDALSVVALRG